MGNNSSDPDVPKLTSIQFFSTCFHKNNLEIFRDGSQRIHSCGIRNSSGSITQSCQLLESFTQLSTIQKRPMLLKKIQKSNSTNFALQRPYIKNPPRTILNMTGYSKFIQRWNPSMKHIANLQRKSIPLWKSKRAPLKHGIR